MKTWEDTHQQWQRLSDQAELNLESLNAIFFDQFLESEDKSYWYLLEDDIVIMLRIIVEGQVRVDIELKDGLEHGVSTVYFAHGVVFRTVEYQNGLRQGSYKSFYPKGKLYSQKEYDEGELHGLCIHWTPEDPPRMIEKYRCDHGCILGHYISDLAGNFQAPLPIDSPDHEYNQAESV